MLIVMKILALLNFLRKSSSVIEVELYRYKHRGSLLELDYCSRLISLTSSLSQINGFKNAKTTISHSTHNAKMQIKKIILKLVALNTEAMSNLLCHTLTY